MIHMFKDVSMFIPTKLAMMTLTNCFIFHFTFNIYNHSLYYILKRSMMIMSPIHDGNKPCFIYTIKYALVI